MNLSWWQSLIIGGAALAISTLATVIKNPAAKLKYYNVAVSIWQSAKQLQTTMLMLNPEDPNFQ